MVSTINSSRCRHSPVAPSSSLACVSMSALLSGSVCRRTRPSLHCRRGGRFVHVPRRAREKTNPAGQIFPGGCLVEEMPPRFARLPGRRGRRRRRQPEVVSRVFCWLGGCGTPKITATTEFHETPWHSTSVQG